MNILRTAGYYNVINGYKTPFLDKAKSSIQGEDFYKDGTTIEQIYSLYLFDRS
ncbi:MAG: Abi family protein [Anaerovibrio sp.]